MASLLERTRRLRLAVLLLVLVALAAWLAADTTGVLGRLAAAEGALEGKLQVGHGVEVERVRLTSPPCQLLVARVPRRAGLRLRAVRLVAGSPGLAPLGAVERLGALVAINGDYHRLDGPCAGLPYSTLIDGDGTPPVTLGSPFDYACAFHLDAGGAPAVSRLDLGAAVRLPGLDPRPAFEDLESGALVLRAHAQEGPWSPGTSALPLTPSGVDPATFTVRGPWTTGPVTGPALLAASVDDGLRAASAVGATLHLEVTGQDAGRVRLAIGSGPRLVEGGQVCARLDGRESDPPGFYSRAPRTAVGVTPDRVLLVVTLQGSHQGLSLPDLGRALVALGCTDAENLDGGPSTALWAGGRVLNAAAGLTTNDVATALVVLPPGAPGVELR